VQPAATLGLAIRRILKRPVRSFLLLQGTVWGVAVAVFPSAIVAGTREAAVTRGAEFGADRVTVAADPTSAVTVTLDAGDVAVARRAVEAEEIEVKAIGGLRVVRVFGNEEKEAPPRAALLAADVGLAEARGLEVAAGRWLRAADGEEACFVEAGVARWLGLERLAPGDRIRLPGGSRDLVVVGVARARSALSLRTNDQGMDLEHPLYQRFGETLLYTLGMPIVRDDWKRSDRCVYVRHAGGPVDWIYLRVPPRDAKWAAAAIHAALADRKKPVVALHPLAISVLLGDQMDRFRAVNAAMFLACLVMGAVVMANLGLLTVLSRTREIAIRRVEGATQGAIAGHFLLEGLLLAALGSGLGLALGMALASLRLSLEPASGLTWAFPPLQAAIAVGAALVIGLLAALLPALRAARQDPVEGLDDE
jgi:putative ABC transport system permease protein